MKSWGDHGAAECEIDEMTFYCKGFNESIRRDCWTLPSRMAEHGFGERDGGPVQIEKQLSRARRAFVNKGGGWGVGGGGSGSFFCQSGTLCLGGVAVCRECVVSVCAQYDRLRPSQPSLSQCGAE